MRIYDQMIENMQKRALSLEDAKVVMQEIFDNPTPALAMMSDRWADQASDYPGMLLGMTWDSVRECALAYLAKNHPKAFNIPMFYGAERLEQYKKDHDFDGWLAKRKEEVVVEEKPYSIFDEVQSLSGSYIKGWCEHHFANKTEHSKYAAILLMDYWEKDTKRGYEPSPRAFYFAKRSKNASGLESVRLIRDLDKSPKALRRA